MSNIIIFTDGSSRGNPGPGGWGSVVLMKNEKSKMENVESHPPAGGQTIKELGGGEKNTTNNKMELNAAVQGISHTPQNSVITLYTDSSYVINGITKWIQGWKTNGWKTKTKDDVLNKVLWMELDSCLENRMVQWKYVGGHVGIVGNERCDHIATAFADGRKVKLYDGPFVDYDLPNILDIKADSGLVNNKKSDSSRSKAKAYSYISVVGGIILTHRTWAECEARVKGIRGARFKKSLNIEEEQDIIKPNGSKQDFYSLDIIKEFGTT